MVCRNCGKEIPESSKHCKYCGAKQDSTTENNNKPKETKPEKETPKKKSSLPIILGALVVCVIVAMGILFGVRFFDGDKSGQKETAALAEADIRQEGETTEDPSEEDGNKEEDGDKEEDLTNSVSSKTDGESERKELNEDQKKAIQELTSWSTGLLPYKRDTTEGEIDVLFATKEDQLNMYNTIAFTSGDNRAEDEKNPVYPESKWEDQGIDGISGWGFVSSNAEEMKAFLKMVFGWSFTIEAADAEYGYAERDGRIYGPGFSYGDSETGIDETATDFQIDEDGRLTVTISCDEIWYGPEGDQVINHGEKISIWNYNPASPLYYTMDTYKEQWEKPVYSYDDPAAVLPDEAEAGSKTNGILLSSEEFESRIQHIRSIYYEIQAAYTGYEKAQAAEGTTKVTRYRSGDGRLTKVSLETELNGSLQGIEYYYENDDLLFAFLLSGQSEYRFYFANGSLIRWIDETGTIHDQDYGNSVWSSWENTMITFLDGVTIP